MKLRSITFRCTAAQFNRLQQAMQEEYSDTRTDNRLYILKLRIHTAGEENDAQRYDAYELRRLRALELYLMKRRTGALSGTRYFCLAAAIC